MIQVQFFPEKDSISYYYSEGGLGGGEIWVYDGIKTGSEQ
jgi:hypothetical protein